MNNKNTLKIPLRGWPALGFAKVRPGGERWAKAKKVKRICLGRERLLTIGFRGAASPRPLECFVGTIFFSWLHPKSLINPLVELTNRTDPIPIALLP